jgi:hypothetical protein
MLRVLSAPFATTSGLDHLCPRFVPLMLDVHNLLERRQPFGQLE